MENFMRALSFHLHPDQHHALMLQHHALMLQQREETLRMLTHTSPEDMENFMEEAHIMLSFASVHQHPVSVYPPFLRQQQNMIYREMPTKFTWTFPGSKNVLKLNTDGSSRGNPGPSSFGGLIRDHTGSWLCGYMGKMKGRSYTSLEAEIWSIYKGLCLVKEKNISNVLIETDCQAALMIRARDLEKDDPMKSVVEAMETIMMEQKCTLIHTRRDGNHCADLLAKLGGKQTEEYSVLEEPPAILTPYLLQDNHAACKFEWERQNNY